MAPVLQCPECGTKHPLSDVPDAGTFPCRGCGRALKVPELVPRSARSSAPPAAPAAPPPAVPEPVAPEARNANPTAPPAPAPATRAMPPVAAESARSNADPLPVLARGTSIGSVPIWARLALWLLAVPISFFVVFAFARGVGLFTSDQQSDVFLAQSISRFWPVIRLLPFVALLTAALVHGGVYALARWRSQRNSTR